MRQVAMKFVKSVAEGNSRCAIQTKFCLPLRNKQHVVFSHVSLVDLGGWTLFYLQKTTEKMSKMTKTVTATILSMSLLTVMAAAAIAPAMGIIRQHFASAPDMLVQLIISLLFLLQVWMTRRFQSLPPED